MGLPRSPSARPQRYSLACNPRNEHGSWVFHEGKALAGSAPLPSPACIRGAGAGTCKICGPTKLREQEQRGTAEKKGQQPDSPDSRLSSLTPLVREKLLPTQGEPFFLHLPRTAPSRADLRNCALNENLFRLPFENCRQRLRFIGQAKVMSFNLSLETPSSRTLVICPNTQE